tara:strand:- start:456 stop:854 length:399 start_codon:yes stop_codon:yes gene_type:complete
MPQRKKKVFDQQERKLVEKEDSEKYAIVLKELGNCRFRLKLDVTGKEIVGRLRGIFRKGRRKRKNRVSTDTVVLVSLRDFQDNVVDIIHVYKPDEVKKLVKTGEIVGFNVRNTDNEDSYQEDEETGFDFEDI